MVNNDDVLAWMNSNAIDSLGRYLQSGRIYQDLSAEELATKCTKAIRAVARDLKSAVLLALMAMLCSKLSESSH
jgi:hypothetical protein